MGKRSKTKKRSKTSKRTKLKIPKTEAGRKKMINQVVQLHEKYEKVINKWEKAKTPEIKEKYRQELKKLDKQFDKFPKAIRDEGSAIWIEK